MKQVIHKVLVSFTLSTLASSTNPLASFGPPHANATVANATLARYAGVADASACAAACLALPAEPRCIGFAVAPAAAAGGLDCLALGWSNTYAVVANATGASYFSRLIDRDGVSSANCSADTTGRSSRSMSREK